MASHKDGVQAQSLANDQPYVFDGTGAAPGKHAVAAHLSLEEVGPIQSGFWVPNRTYATVHYMAPLRRHVATLRNQRTLTFMHPVISEFKAWVLANSVYRMWLQTMIGQANGFVIQLDDVTKEEIKADGDTLWIKDSDEFFEVLNEIIHTSPALINNPMIGTPMNGFLAVGMGTEAGAALFHDTTFNLQFKKVLDAWNGFLKSPASLDKLDIADPEKKGSWISAEAHRLKVWDQMEYDSSKPGYGFDSWNSFFIRRFVKDARPFQGVATKDVNIGCETTPWAYSSPVHLETYFWIKEVNYSLLDLFGGRKTTAEHFVGGQLYQGFLSATHYHRWHAPIDGDIVLSWVQPGTYFAQRPAQGQVAGSWEGTQSQPYLGHVAARAIFVFSSPVFGLVALICIGMVEVSTCYIDPNHVVPEGHQPVKVKRGDEIGHFEFGGSTHVMIFQKGKVELRDWAKNAVKHQGDTDPTPMGSIIGSVVSA